MRCGYKHVQRMHWTFTLSHGYGRKMTWIIPNSSGYGGASNRGVRGRHSSAHRAGRIFDTPSLAGYTFVDLRLHLSTRRFWMRSFEGVYGRTRAVDVWENL